MNKKIIAILLVFTLVITCFVACQKQKYETTKINGQDVLLATDEDGNTMINDDNQIVAVVTDREGEIITYENGEEQTYLVDMPETSIKGNGYSLILNNDWIYNENINTYLKKGHEKDIYVSVGEFENNYSSLDEYMVETEKSSKEFIDAVKEAYPNTEISITDGVVTSRNLPCKVVETKIKDDEGKMFYYGYAVDFEYNGAVVVISYTSQNYSYEETDVLELFNEAFIFEEIKD